MGLGPPVPPSRTLASKLRTVAPLHRCAAALTHQAGVEGFTNVLRHETVGTNIRVLINRPGTVRTEFHTRRNLYDLDKTDGFLGGMCPLAAEDIAVSVFWQCLQPERISVITMETLPTAQRSLYAADKEYEQRNGVGKCDEWQR
jgi:NAD(P)-dependent dehydrogenase (short-subunit alcohol dehydrogenase family)